MDTFFYVLARQLRPLSRDRRAKTGGTTRTFWLANSDP